MSPTATPGVEELPKKRFLLLYGSATGQAQAITEEIAEKAPGFGLTPELHALEETGKRFNIERERCIVIVCSTTGDGDPPANAEKFVRRIKKRTLSSNHLSHLQYALLGLGDSNYSQFCRCSRDMDSRLQALGAKPFYPTGLADDGEGLEVVAEPWLEGLYPALQSFLSVDEPTSSLTERVEAMSLVTPCNSGHTTTDQLEQKVQQMSADGKDTTDSSLGGAGKDVDHTHSPPTDIDQTRTTSVGEDTPVLDNGQIERSNSVLSTSGEATVLNKTSGQPKISHRSTFYDSQREQETQCIPLSDAQDRSTCPLVCPDCELAEKSLKVPVLPPDFLKASFSCDVIKLEELHHQNGLKLPCAAGETQRVKVTSTRVLTHPDAVKKTLLLSLDLQGCGIEYSPGDSISVICPNSCSEVDLLLERLRMSDKADDCMTLSVLPETTKRRAAVPPHIHATTTLRLALMTCVNIREPPSKALMRALVEFTSNQTESRRLQELCSKEGAHIYSKLVREKNISLLDFLYAFPSCTPPIERLLEHLPRLQPRPYSACSCALVDKDRLDIVFNVVEVLASMEDGHFYHRRGVCTGWLDDVTQRLQTVKQVEGVEQTFPAVKIPIFLRTNQHFRPPEDLSRPTVMIGPGTGVAPFVGFLQERGRRRLDLPVGATYGETWLFYGCRHRNKDFLFRDELKEFEADGTLTHLCVTFSRDDSADIAPDHPEADVKYVQDLLRLKCQDIARLVVEEDALIYVCGDASGMAKDVTAAFEDILQQEKDFSKEEANMFIMKKRLHKTYFEDVWT